MPTVSMIGEPITPRRQPPAHTNRRLDVEVLRDVAALVLLIAGCAGLTWAGFLWCLPAGVAAVSLACGAAGAALAYRR